MYSDFVFLDRFLFELLRKNTHTHKHGRTHTHRDSNEYPIVAFSKKRKYNNPLEHYYSIGEDTEQVLPFSREL